MTIKTQELKDILNMEEDDLKKLSVEQLRILMGVAHYLSRIVQRELNGRLGEFSTPRKGQYFAS